MVLAALLLAGGPAFAATGSALGVAQGASVQQPSGTHVLTIGEDVFIGDLVITDASGQVQIRFDDDTELVVGPASSLRIEDYLRRADGSAGKLAINALGGTFRFVTGSAPKKRYLIETPTGTIGVRGTTFDFNVNPKATQVIVYHGATVLCSQTQQCVELNDSCEVGQFGSRDSEVIGRTKKVNAQTRADLRAAFSLAQNQGSLLSGFRISGAGNCFPKSLQRQEPPPQPIEGAVELPPPPAPPPVEPPPVAPPPVDPPPVDPPPVDPPPVDPPPCDCGHPHDWDHHDGGDHHGDGHHDGGHGGGGFGGGGGYGGGGHGGGGGGFGGGGGHGGGGGFGGGGHGGSNH